MTRIDMALVVERLGRISSGRDCPQVAENATFEADHSSDDEYPSSSGTETSQPFSQREVNTSVRADGHTIGNSWPDPESRPMLLKLWQILAGLAFSAMKNLRFA